MGSFSPSDFDKAVAALKAGHPVLFPTDTVYGLGVAVDCAPGPQALFRLKGRASDKPIAWLVGAPDDLFRYGEAVDPAAAALVEKEWPGPLTVVVRASVAVPPAFASAQGTIGLRMPDCPVALRLIHEVGCPLATTSANFAGRPPAVCAADVDPALLAKVPSLLQDDPCAQGRPSRVIDCSRSAVQILRD